MESCTDSIVMKASRAARNFSRQERPPRMSQYIKGPGRAEHGGRVPDPSHARMMGVAAHHGRRALNGVFCLSCPARVQLHEDSKAI
eukprot:s1948_g16.t1